MKRLLLLTIMMIAMAIANAQIIHVPGDQSSIQAGIDAANFWGDTVLVDDGTYTENIDFSGKFITVASNFILDGDTNHINNTIIDGSDPSNPDNGSVVYFQTEEDTTSVLCGFTITGGSGTWVPADNIRTGGGILIINCGAKILHNYIIDNHVVTNLIGSGGGISIGDATNNNDYVIIRQNRIVKNTVEAADFAEGGGMSIYSNAIVEDNIISFNEISSEVEQSIGGGIRAVGVLESQYICCANNIISNNIVNSSSMTVYGGAGAMQAYNCFGNISNNFIQDNEVTGPTGSVAGGLHFGYCGSSMILENNLISDNTSNDEDTGGLGGGVTLYSSNIQLINNVIVRNYAEKGGGIQNHFNLDGPTQFINNTIADNEGDGDGTAIYLEDADAIVLNSILWNDGDEIYVSGGSIEVAYSDILDGWTGEGNINEDPDFLDDTYHLQGGPCVDAGIDELIMMGMLISAPDHDFDGQPRPMCGGYDMGADEALCEGVFENPPSNHFNLRTNPNPSSGIINIKYELKDVAGVTLSISNIRGDRLESYNYGKKAIGEQTVMLDLSHLPDGLYMIRLQVGNQVETAKIILLK